jgi:hypothetical protein
LEHAPLVAKNWKQRAIDNARLLASGSPFDLADVVKSLTQLSDANALLPRDRQALDKARQFLICEISEVLEQSRDAAKDQTEKALDGKIRTVRGGALSFRGGAAQQVYTALMFHRREALAPPILKQSGGYGNTKPLNIVANGALVEDMKVHPLWKPSTSWPPFPKPATSTAYSRTPQNTQSLRSKAINLERAHRK